MRGTPVLMQPFDSSSEDIDKPTSEAESDVEDRSGGVDPSSGSPVLGQPFRPYFCPFIKCKKHGKECKSFNPLKPHLERVHLVQGQFPSEEFLSAIKRGACGKCLILHPLHYRCSLELEDVQPKVP